MTQYNQGSLAAQDLSHRHDIKDLYLCAGTSATGGTFESAASWMLPREYSLPFSPGSTIFSLRRLRGYVDDNKTTICIIHRFCCVLSTDQGKNADSGAPVRYLHTPEHMSIPCIIELDRCDPGSIFFCGMILHNFE
jgi:hypothetical protein